MNRKQLIYITDLTLIPLFVISLYTGISLHFAGHSANHQVWHNWAMLHSITSLLFAIFGIIHIKTHLGWYKGLKLGCIKDKVKIVLLLTLFFTLVICTGTLLLLYIEGANSLIGLLHYKIGIILGVIGILHILERVRFLRNGYTSIITKCKKLR